VRDDDKCLAERASPIEEESVDRLGVAFIEISRRLIGEEKIGIVDERAGKCDALLFSPREKFCRGIPSIEESHIREKFFGACIGGAAGRGALSSNLRRDENIRERRLFFEEMKSLKDKPDVLASEAREAAGGWKKAADFDRTRGGAVEKSQEMQKGAFSLARFPHDHDPLTGGDIE
jgi:hypothetical protein